MKLKSTLLQWLWALLFLTACGLSFPEKIPSTTKDPIPSPRFTPLSTFTLLPPAPPIQPTATHLPTFTPTPIIPFSIDRIRWVYAQDGNIYVRDGLNSPKQLTFSGHDQDPILSDDGEKVVFYRGEANDNVYSINADGSDELLIIESKSFGLLSQGEIKALTFVPNSHSVLFNTYLCNPSIPGSYNAPDCVVGLYGIDTDSGKIGLVVSGLSGNRLHDRNFEISPDGEWISVAASGHVDVYNFHDLYAQLVYLDAISYHRTFPDEFLPGQYWLPDSSGFIAIVAAEGSSNEPTTPPSNYTAFRYKIQDKQALHISLEKEIMWGFGSEATSWSVSPDRNWIYFLNNDSFQLGNLSNGQVQTFEGIGGDLFFFNWSTDSKHFTFNNGSIGSVNGSLTPLDGYLVDWLDPIHYIYVIYDSKGAIYNIGEIGGETVPLPDNFTLPSDFVVLGVGAIP